MNLITENDEKIFSTIGFKNDIYLFLYLFIYLYIIYFWN